MDKPSPPVSKKQHTAAAPAASAGPAGAPPGGLPDYARLTSAGLKAEISRMRAELESTIREHRDSNEELRVLNEEAQDLNEELQSANEELRMNKLELQSVNEALTTTNGRLHAKMLELRAANDDLDSLLSSTNIAVLFLDPGFRVRRYTPAIQDLLELRPSDIGRPVTDFARMFRDDALLDDVQAALMSREPREVEVISQSGRIYLRRALPYLTGEGDIDGIVVAFVDISERKHTEAALRNNQRLSQLILDNIPDYAIFILDPEGRILNWPAGAERVLGYTPDEAMGQSLSFLMTEEDRRRGLQEIEMRDATETGVGEVAGWRVRRDGSRFWATCRLYALKEDGEVQGFIKLLRDNTERKRTEDALNAAKEAAEEANASKDHFLATVSHELRTPLSALLLWAKMLTEGPALSPAQMHEGLDAIKKCAEEQRELIEDLVDTSRIVAGKLRLDCRPTELVTMMRSALEAIRPTALEKGVQVGGEFDSAAGLVLVDPHRLQQVVWNLLTNAVKFTPARGRIYLTLQRHGAEVEIRVADTGQGISADFLPRIFDRFRQAAESTTRTHSGLGLGLSITRQLVELHAGTITTESPGLDQGATFVVRLPLPALDPAQQPGPDSLPPLDTVQPRPRLDGLRVLLVEDSPDTRKALITVLRQAGASVSAFGTAEAALQEYRRQAPDIVLSDIGLPEVDGFELLGRIRRWEKEQTAPAVPAVALTAYADERNRRRAIESDFQKCLTKPVEADHLLSVLARLAQHN
jgi:two-component system CheB/CheR fusion protein